MIASFDPVREGKRPSEYADARQRALAAREARIAARRAEADTNSASAVTVRDAALVKELTEVEDTLRSKNYADAETHLKEMLKNYPREARIFFALGQTASLAAMDATDDTIQAERLNRALGQYRLAVQAASPEFDKAILSRAHESMGRINAFLENKEEAIREFDEAIKIGDVNGGAYQQALEGKKRLIPN
jgi:tetratricopeptide (TPR) repeat protein